MSLKNVSIWHQAEMVDTFNFSTREAKAGRSLRVWGQLDLQSEFQYSQNYTQRNLVSKNKTNQNKKIPYEVEDYLSNFSDELCWNFDGDCIDSVDCLWWNDQYWLINLGALFVFWFLLRWLKIFPYLELSQSMFWAFC